VGQGGHLVDPLLAERGGGQGLGLAPQGENPSQELPGIDHGQGPVQARAFLVLGRGVRLVGVPLLARRQTPSLTPQPKIPEPVEVQASTFASHPGWVPWTAGSEVTVSDRTRPRWKVRRA
jgi:hypothetical protein